MHAESFLDALALTIGEVLLFPLCRCNLGALARLPELALLVLFLRIRLCHHSYSEPHVEGQQAAARRFTCLWVRVAPRHIGPSKKFRDPKTPSNQNIGVDPCIRLAFLVGRSFLSRLGH